MAVLSPDPAESLLGALGHRLGPDGLVHLERLPARPPRYGSLARPLPPARERLEALAGAIGLLPAASSAAE